MQPSGPSILTSYFAAVPQLADQYPNHALVSIARRKPDWLELPTWFQLAPSRNLLWSYKNGDVTEEQFTETYLLRLGMMNAKATVGALVDCYGPRLVLLCWERPYEFCHRKLAARWLLAEGGVEVLEAIL